MRQGEVALATASSRVRREMEKQWGENRAVTIQAVSHVVSWSQGHDLRENG